MSNLPSVYEKAMLEGTLLVNKFNWMILTSAMSICAWSNLIWSNLYSPFVSPNKSSSVWGRVIILYRSKRMFYCIRSNFVCSYWDLAVSIVNGFKVSRIQDSSSYVQMGDVWISVTIIEFGLTKYNEKGDTTKKCSSAIMISLLYWDNWSTVETNYIFPSLSSNRLTLHKGCLVLVPISLSVSLTYNTANCVYSYWKTFISITWCIPNSLN